MLTALAVGEPSLGRLAGDGELDVAALALAATILVLLKVVLQIRVRWPLALVILLAAPLLVGLSHEIGYPVTLALILAIGAIVSAARRRMGSTQDPS